MRGGPRDGDDHPPGPGRNGEREAALARVDGVRVKGRITLGAERPQDHTRIAHNEQVKENVALRRSRAVDGCTTRHPSYAVGLRIRKRIDEVSGCAKTTGGPRKIRHKGTARVDCVFTPTAAASSSVMLPKLMAAA